MDSNKSIIKVRFRIDGMTCSSCVSTIHSHVSAMKDIIQVEVNLQTNIATIEFYENDVLTVDYLLNEIESIGYGCEILETTKIADIENNLNESMSTNKVFIITITSVYDSNSIIQNYSSLENKLKNIDGVIEIKNNNKYLTITIDTTIIGPRNIYNIAREHSINIIIESLGGYMTASKILIQQNYEFSKQFYETVFSLCLTIPLLIFSMILPQFQTSLKFLNILILPGLNIYSLILFLLCTPIEFYIGYRFHAKAFMSLKTWNFGMDFLVSTGTLAAYIYSTISLIINIIHKELNNDSIEYYETSAVLITMVILGKFLETYAKGKTAVAINKLTSHRARNARLIVDKDVINYNKSLGYEISDYLNDFVNIEDNNDVIIDVLLVQKGDCLRLLTGEYIPADGILTAGCVSVDESMLTGESKLVTKEVGSLVYGGTMVMEGSGNIVVTASGDDSTLGKIVSAVQNAQSSRPPIQELADKIAVYFVPTVLIISLITFLAWIIVWLSGKLPYSFYSHRNMSDGHMSVMGSSNASASHGNPILFAFFFALAVWVSACPCAFGLATPTAILISTGLAAKYGILIRKGAAIQHAAETNIIAFDKTGTLTLGQPNVTDLFMINDNDEVVNLFVSKVPDKFVNRMICILTLYMRAESRSNHPIATSIVNYCKERLNEISNQLKDMQNQLVNDYKDVINVADDNIEFEVIPGLGIKMKINCSNNHSIFVLIGSFNLMKDNNVTMSSKVMSKSDSLRSGGKIVIYMSINNVLSSVLSLSDTVRPEAFGVISTLKQNGYTCYMITGDEKNTAFAIGKSLGFDHKNIYCNTKPMDKELIIKILQNKNKNSTVLFIGDGTNDTPAMARANVSVAMSSGTDIAIESGDIIFCKNSLESLPVLLDLSKATMHRIYMNYCWALIYNIILIPLAAGVFYPTYKFSLAPMMAGVAMALSSVSVVTSSLLLNFFKPKELFVDQPMTNLLDSSHDVNDTFLCSCPTSSMTNKILKKNNWNFLSLFYIFRKSDLVMTSQRNDVGIQISSPMKNNRVKSFDKTPFQELSNTIHNESIVVDNDSSVTGCGCNKMNCKCNEGCQCDTTNIE